MAWRSILAGNPNRVDFISLYENEIKQNSINTY